MIDQLFTAFFTISVTNQDNIRILKFAPYTAGPIAERSKSSDLDRGRGDPGSKPGRGRIFSTFFRDGEQNIHHIVCVYS